MAKSLVINALGTTSKSFSLPCDDTVAASFCAAILDGEYSIYSKTGEAGTDSGITGYNDVKVQISSDSGSKTYFGFLAKSGVTDVEIQNALKGMTINGVKADTVFVTMRPVVVGA